MVVIAIWDSKQRKQNHLKRKTFYFGNMKLKTYEQSNYGIIGHKN